VLNICVTLVFCRVLSCTIYVWNENKLNIALNTWLRYLIAYWDIWSNY